AARLSARAFTIGPSIYFGDGEYQPATTRGRHVLAHEAAHAHQQVNASLPATQQLLVSSPSNPEEVTAERFASALSSGTRPEPPTQATSGNIARLMRLS